MLDDNYEMDDLLDKNKKKSREERKLEKIKAKQDKLDAKQKENDKILNKEEVKFTKVDTDMIDKKLKDEALYKEFKKEKQNKNKDTKQESKNGSVTEFLYNMLFGFITILLFVTSIGYLGYNYYKNNTINNLISGILLVCVGLFYMLSMFSKKSFFKKIFAIITSLSLMGFMAFNLFMI